MINIRPQEGPGLKSLLNETHHQPDAKKKKKKEKKEEVEKKTFVRTNTSHCQPASYTLLPCQGHVDRAHNKFIISAWMADMMNLLCYKGLAQKLYQNIQRHV